ncbi:MAG TPA: glycosyltransferase, partial [Anaerolineae bacterium]|nr:glycosyltransferase [Anaerolineae bacterium]
MKVLILTTDAGGGHRSVARALAASFEEAGGAGCDVRVVDFAGYAPFPLSRTREMHRFMMHHPALYSAFYDATNARDGWVINGPAVGLAMEAGMRRLLCEHQPDVVVTTHPLASPSLVSVLHRHRARLPYYTVVTDFGRVHTFWAYPFGELWFAPCEETAGHLVRSGIPAERVVITGYAVHPRFARRSRPAAELRRELGLEPDRFTVLVIGGAEGVGPLEEVVTAIASAPGPWQLIVIAGRNEALRERLEAQRATWPVPVHVDGLVDDMPSRMHAADLLLSKGGPATLSEALTCGLPAFLTSVLPG